MVGLILAVGIVASAPVKERAVIVPDPASWTMAQKTAPEKWMPAVVPGTVLTTLVKNGIVPDPYRGLNNRIQNHLIPDLSENRDFYSATYRAKMVIPADWTKDKTVWMRPEGINSRGYVTAGRVTGATPDGRCRGDELSKNMAPSIGGDAEGVTAVLNSWAASIDPAFFPCGLVFDVMLHASSVAGEKGLKVFRALCENYFEHGGCGLNLNVQSVEELKDAQLHPEKYENLQVRVAGWNVRWNEIPKKEQDGFIRRLEAMPE